MFSALFEKTRAHGDSHLPPPWAGESGASPFVLGVVWGGRTTVVLEDLWDPLGFYIYKEMLLAVMVFIDALYISVKFLIISVLVR